MCGCAFAIIFTRAQPLLPLHPPTHTHRRGVVSVVVHHLSSSELKHSYANNVLSILRFSKLKTIFTEMYYLKGDSDENVVARISVFLYFFIIFLYTSDCSL